MKDTVPICLVCRGAGGRGEGRSASTPLNEALFQRRGAPAEDAAWTWAEECKSLRRDSPSRANFEPGKLRTVTPKVHRRRRPCRLTCDARERYN